MKTKECLYNKIKCCIIYITKKEQNDKNIQHDILLLKNKYGAKNLAIFISGEKDIEPVLTNLIQDYVNKN